MYLFKLLQDINNVACNVSQSVVVANTLLVNICSTCFEYFAINCQRLLWFQYSRSWPIIPSFDLIPTPSCNDNCSLVLDIKWNTQVSIAPSQVTRRVSMLQLRNSTSNIPISLQSKPMNGVLRNFRNQNAETIVIPRILEWLPHLLEIDVYFFSLWNLLWWPGNSLNHFCLISIHSQYILHLESIIINSCQLRDDIFGRRGSNKRRRMAKSAQVYFLMYQHFGNLTFGIVFISQYVLNVLYKSKTCNNEVCLLY